MNKAMEFAEFEARVGAEADLALSPFYWNATLHETTGRAIWCLFLGPALRALRRPSPIGLLLHEFVPDDAQRILPTGALKDGQPTESRDGLWVDDDAAGDEQRLIAIGTLQGPIVARPPAVGLGRRPFHVTHGGILA